jgi:two-component system, OmpR family, response regulator MtrA
MESPTVLVVDDDPVILHLLEVNFDLEGWAVVTATNGQEALDAVRGQRPDVAVVDVMMPVLSGLDFVKQLRADAAIAGTAVVLLSAKAQTNDVRAGMALGADDYVTKPFEPIDLVERVKQLFERRSGAGAGGL